MSSRHHVAGKPRSAPYLWGVGWRALRLPLGIAVTVAVAAVFTPVSSYGGTVLAQSACAPSVVGPSVPGQPTDLSASFANGIFELSWRAPTDKGNPPLEGYRVQHDPTEGLLTESATTTSRVLSEWKGIGVSHTLAVAAFNCAGSSPFSSVDSVAAELPSVPRSFEVVIAGTFAVATWKSPASSGSARNITGYSLSYQGGGLNTADVSHNVFEHIWSGLSPGSSYTFKIAAKSRYGTGASATTSTSVPLPNDAPRSFSATYLNGDIALSWVAPTSADSTPISGYNLTIKVGGSSTTANLPAAATSYNINDPVSGGKYSFTLVAITGSSEGTAVSISISVPSLPTAPRNLSASRTDGNLTVTWDAPSSAGASAITGYDVTWSSGSTNGSSQLSATSTSYSIASVAAGNTYSISVTASNSSGSGPPASISYTVPSPPGMPRALDAELQQNGSYRVSWESPRVTGTSPITKYRLEWTKHGDTAMNTTDTTSLFHDIESPSLGVEYSFSLFAFNSVGKSPAATLVVTVPSPPGKVRNLQIQHVEGELQVSWDAPSYAGTRELNGYQLRWQVDEAVTTSTVRATMTTYDIDEAVQGKTYTVSVVARNAEGSGPSTTIEFLVPNPPSPPRNFAAKMSDGHLKLTWEAPSAPGTSAVSGYNISWTVDSTTKRANLALASRSYVIESPGTGKTYQFEISASNSAGAGPSTSLTFTVPTPPGAPTGLTASINANGALVITWSAPESTLGTPAVKRYELSWMVSHGGSNGSAQINANARKHELVSPTAGSTYSFTLVAVNDVGNSASATVSFAVPKVPGAPTGLTASIDNSGRLAVSWVQPTYLGVPNLTGYLLSWTVADQHYSVSKSANQLAHSITSPTAGAQYDFTVVATNSAGSGASATVSFTVPIAPDAPRNIAATYSSRGIEVAWTAPAKTGVPKLNGYSLTWQIRAPRTGATTSGAATTNADTLEHLIANPVPGSKYDFSLVARNSTGNSSPVTATLTVPSRPDPPRNVDAEVVADGSLRVSWQAPSYQGTATISGYRLTWTLNSSSTTVSTSATTKTHTISSPTPGARYTFSVTATNSVGQSDASTNYLLVPEPPTSPLNLAWSLVKSGSTQDIEIRWDAPESSGSSPVTGFQLRYTVDRATTSKSMSASVRSYTIKNPTLGASYALTLTAVTNDGTSDASLTFTVPKPPSAPTDFRVALTEDAAISLTWGAPDDTGTAAVSRFLLTVNISTTESQGTSANTELSHASRSHEISDPEPGKTYRFSLIAESDAGAGPPATASITIPEVPSKPAGLTATHQNNGSVVVKWKRPANYQVAAINSYTWTWRLGTQTATGTETSLDSPQFTISDPVLGGTYTIEVKTVGKVGSSPAAKVTYTVPAPPGVPRGLTADIDSGDILVEWSSPANTGTARLTGYQLTWRVLSSSTEAPDELNLTADAVSYAIPSPRYGEVYTITLRAKTTAGIGVAATLQYRVPTVPSIPTSLVATYTNGTTRIGWSPPLTNGGSPIIGYELSWEPFTGVATVALDAATRHYDLNSLSEGTVYRFAVIARNNVGRGPIAVIDFEVAEGEGTGITFDDNEPELGLGFAASFIDMTVRFTWFSAGINNEEPILHYIVSWAAVSHEQRGTVKLPADATKYELRGLSQGGEYAVSLVVVGSNGNWAPIARFFTVPPNPTNEDSTTLGAPGTTATYLQLRRSPLVQRAETRGQRVTAKEVYQWEPPTDLQLYQWQDTVQIYWEEPQHGDPLGWTVSWMPDPPDMNVVLPSSARSYEINAPSDPGKVTVKVRAIYPRGLGDRAKATMEMMPLDETDATLRSEYRNIRYGLGGNLKIRDGQLQAHLRISPHAIPLRDEVRFAVRSTSLPAIDIRGHDVMLNGMSMTLEADLSSARRYTHEAGQRYGFLTPLLVCLTTPSQNLPDGTVYSVISTTESRRAKVLESVTSTAGSNETCANISAVSLDEPTHFGLVRRQATALATDFGVAEVKSDALHNADAGNLPMMFAASIASMVGTLTATVALLNSKRRRRDKCGDVIDAGMA